MNAFSRNGVCYFEIYNYEKTMLPTNFMQNKILVKGEFKNEIYRYNYSYDNLIIKDQVYFNSICSRTYFSNKKEYIFKELNLIENENGIFSNYSGGHEIEYSLKNLRFYFSSLPFLGDYINSKKIKEYDISYDLIKKIGEGYFDF